MSNVLGFTLIELLVAISIIAVLSTVGITTFRGTTSKAQDSVRKQDLQKLAQALEMYSQTNNKYVLNSGSCTKNTAGSNLYSDTNFAKLITGSLPKDPKTNTNYCYESADGLTYKLYAKLEDGSDYILTSEDYIAQVQPQTPAQSQPQAAPAAAPQAQDSSLPPPPIATQLPVVCSGFNITETAAPFGVYNSGESLQVAPELKWDNIAKVEVKQYEYPDPMASPFAENNWKLLGNITRTPQYQCLRWNSWNNGLFCGDINDCPCVEYGKTIVGYDIAGPDQVCVRRSGSGRCAEYAPAVKWTTPDYPGNYYLGMEAYDSSGKKVAGPSTGNSYKCTKEVFVQRWQNTCRDNRPVLPANIKANVSGNNVLVQWLVQNSDSTYDNSTAYTSSQAGFSITPSKRVVSRLKSGTSERTYDTTYVSNGKPAFYKVTAFSSAGESPSSETQGYMSGITVRSGSDYNGPPSASNLTISGNQFSWKYSCCIGVGFAGWRIVGSNGVAFNIPKEEVAETYNQRAYLKTATWNMPTPIVDTYYVQAYGYSNNSTTVVLGGASNTANVSSSTPASSSPNSPPTAVTVSTGYNDSHPITISWSDSNTNEAGFHVYRSSEPLDLSKSTQSSNANSNLQWAYFSNLSSGKHYFAVKTKNNCGNGWSEIVSVDIGSVQGVSTNLFDQLKQILRRLTGSSG